MFKKPSCNCIAFIPIPRSSINNISDVELSSSNNEAMTLSSGTNNLSFLFTYLTPSKNCTFTRLLRASMEFFINSTTATDADVIKSLPKCSIILGLTFILTFFIIIPTFQKILIYFPCNFKCHQIRHTISNHLELCT